MSYQVCAKLTSSFKVTIMQMILCALMFTSRFYLPMSYIYLWPYQMTEIYTRLHASRLMLSISIDLLNAALDLLQRTTILQQRNGK